MPDLDASELQPVPSWLLEKGPRFLLMLAVDGGVAALALYAGFIVRFEGDIPPEHLARMAFALPILVAVRLAVNHGFGLHRWSFMMAGLQEGVRLGLIQLVGTSLFVVICFFLQAAPPRSVIVLEYFFTTTATAAFRFLPRLGLAWLLSKRRSRRSGTQRTLIIGAGSGGDLLYRDLMRSDEHQFQVVGFVDDDPAKQGTYLGGKAVLGTIDQLPQLVERHRIAKVLIAVPRLSPDRIQAILSQCARLKVSFKILPVSYAYLNDRITASMLHDLSPDDLLSREAVGFVPSDIKKLVTKRRVLVTGAAGSIGSEIVRQVAAHEPAALVLVDINENELYLLFRQLEAKYPNLELHTAIADIRDEKRLQQLGELFRPQDVFHAAAHKHVPLMEQAPSEAVKNNILGTMNVAQMADAVGAERFVLISTDKAVRPSSVMGVSKRVAELVVRRLAQKSRTRFTAVRFGNVLGTAGSVVPLFKQQIERGGPVTVTHPECTRYFMTVSEAVGLVLIAGLGGYGELCVLDMGKAINIVELASLMITMAGLVPGEDIKIEFTGLRNGEKLAEELMTEDEEQAHHVRDRVKVANSPPPPSDLEERIEALRRHAELCDQDALVRGLQELVPSYTPDPASRAAARSEQKVLPLRGRAKGV